MNESMNQRWLRWCLSAIVFLLAVIAIQLSVLTGPVTPLANAQVPDGGLQRVQLLEAQQQTTRSVNQLLQHLQTQTIKVRVEGTDKDSKRASARPVAPVPRVVRKQTTSPAVRAP